MQRITASGTRPSTGSPASSRRRSSVLETSNGATGHVDRAPPGGGSTGSTPGRPTTASVTSSARRASSCQVVEAGDHVRPDHQRQLGPGYVPSELADGVDGVGRPAPVDLQAATARARASPRTAASTMAKRSSAGVTTAGPPSARVGWPPPPACGRARGSPAPRRPPPGGPCGWGRRCHRRCRSGRAPVTPRCRPGRPPPARTPPSPPRGPRCREPEVLPPLDRRRSMIWSMVPIRAIGEPSTCSGVTDMAPARRSMASSRSGTIWTRNVRHCSSSSVEPVARRLAGSTRSAGRSTRPWWSPGPRARRSRRPGSD